MLSIWTSLKFCHPVKSKWLCEKAARGLERKHVIVQSAGTKELYKIMNKCINHMDTTENVENCIKQHTMILSMMILHSKFYWLSMINSFPNKPWFLCVYSTSL